MVGVKLAHDPAQLRIERWINYYGPTGEAIPGVGYSEAFVQLLEFFHDKVVFIGARPKTSM